MSMKAKRGLGPGLVHKTPEGERISEVSSELVEEVRALERALGRLEGGLELTE
jgi:hypothetical protein